MPKSAAQKMFLKTGYHAIVINAPDEYITKLGEMPPEIQWCSPDFGPVDFVHLFVENFSQADMHIQNLDSLLKPHALLWISYPKGSSKIKTDINRDSLYQLCLTHGFKAVSMISIDSTWSAMRFKRIE